LRSKKRVVSEKPNNFLLGEILKNAGLVTQAQISKALNHQQELSTRLGEILHIQGVVNIKTIHFMLDNWEKIKHNGYQFPLGYYLQQAFLIDNQQIQIILKEQKNNQLKFGDIAIAKGWIKQKTINFFLDNLSVKPAELISLDSLEQYNQKQLHLELKYNDYSKILSRILAWTKGDPALTKDICQTFANSDFYIVMGEEYRAVDQLVDNKLISEFGLLAS